MYEAYWKLKSRPFDDGAAPGFYAPCRTHQAALLKLRYLVEQGKGIGLIAGEHGLGKTFLTHVLEQEIRDSGRGTCVRLVFPHLNPEDTLSYLAFRMGATMDTRDSHSRLLQRIEDHLAEQKESGQHLVVVVDDAHLLDFPQLNVLKLLVQLREQGTADLSVILSGRGELLSRLGRLAALDQRIVVRAALQPLSREDVAVYLSHRLQVAGRREQVFDSRAADVISELSQGIPRRINQLCDLSLLVGFVDELRAIGPVEIEAAAEELLSVAA